MVAIKFPLRLAATETETQGRERRLFPRKECNSRIEGKRLDHSIAARQNPALSLSLRDVSVGGLSAIASTKMEVGERLAVFFPAQGVQRGWDACGRVLRCEQGAVGYRIAVEFDAIPMAA